MSESTSFDLNAFIKESKETLLNPKAYFSTMPITGGMADPVIKALIYGVVAGIIVFLWGIIGLGGQTGVFGAGIGAMGLVYTVTAAVIGLFIGAVIVLIISAICKGSTDFEACVRVVAAVMVVFPVSALLGFITGISPVLGAIVALCVNLYALYLLYFGLTESLKTNTGTTKLFMYVLVVLLVIFMIAGLSARKKLNKYMDEMSQVTQKELMKDTR